MANVTITIDREVLRKILSMADAHLQKLKEIEKTLPPLEARAADTIRCIQYDHKVY